MSDIDEISDLFADIDHAFNDEWRRPEAKRKGNDKATKQKLLAMCKFIGTFGNWPILDDDCKQKIISYLDYKTRFSLGICSKMDYAIVEKTPQYVYGVEMIDNEKNHYQYSNDEFDNVIVRVQFEADFNSGNRFEKIFSQSGEDTLIRWSEYYPRRRPEKKEQKWENCNYYETAVKYAESWIKKCQFKLTHIQVEMKKYPFESSLIKSLPKCKSIRLCCDDEKEMQWWLEKVPKQLDDVELLTDFAEREVFTLSSEFVSTPHIINSKQLYFWCRAAFSDEQLLQLQAKKISFDAVNITDKGINQFLKHWVRGKHPEDFQRMLLWHSSNHDVNVLVRDLKIRPWDEDFEEEARGFCGDFDRVCGRGQCFQIIRELDPYESLTLSISDDCVSIYWTGKKVTWNGEIMSDYGIP